MCLVLSLFFMLTKQNLFRFSRHNLSQLLGVPLNVRQHMWFQHDGDPPHFRRNVHTHLNNELDG